MTRHHFGLIAVLACLPGCRLIDDWRARRDFERVCEVATAFRRQTGEAPASAQARLAAEIAAALKSNAAKRAFSALAAVEPAQRGEVLKQAALDIGLETYSCPALIGPR